MKLYEIAENYLRALEKIEIDEATGEIMNVDELKEIKGAFEDKAEAVACYIKARTALHDGITAEIKELQARAKSIERDINGLKNYLSFWLQEAGRKKLETPKCQLSFRKSYSVRIDDIDKLTSDYVDIISEIKPLKAEIKAALRDGKEVAGASLIESLNLQVK